jgi:hypothetical protein
MRGIRFYSQSQQTLRGWRKYAHQFRDKPASYLTSFAVLHELTAIVPLPLVYYFLDYSQLNIPVPEDAITEGNRVISKMRTKYGYEPLDPNSRVMVNMVASYAVVKVNFISPHWITTAKVERSTSMRLTYHYCLLGHSPSSYSCFRSHDTVLGRTSCRSYRKNGGPICATCQIIKKTFYTFQHTGFPSFTPASPS